MRQTRRRHAKRPDQVAQSDFKAWMKSVCNSLPERGGRLGMGLPM